MTLGQQSGQDGIEHIQSAVVVHHHVLFHDGQVVVGGAQWLVDAGAIHHHIQALLGFDNPGRGLNRLRVSHVQGQGHAARMI